ncbi:DUF669 domain-containing protein [Ligilactobacillus equi]|uniref:DUF669 domain-containing protein n=1 Tax=Ligilactobacillus equi TaxID=137357 RepID=UPI002ED672CB
MALFTTNYKDVQENNFAPLAEGEYEVLVQSCGEQVTKNGAESMHFKLVVRDDLDQAMPNTNGKFHKRVIFVDEWKRKATGKYDINNFMYFMKAAGIPEGTDINTMQDFEQMMWGKPVRVYVKLEDHTYNGQTTKRNTVAPYGWSQTKFPMQQQASPFEQTDVKNDDLPF